MKTNNCIHSKVRCSGLLRYYSGVCPPLYMRSIELRVGEYETCGLKNRDGFMAIRAVFQADLLRRP